MIRGFNAIKEGLRSAVDLYLPTPNGKWKITTDACDYAVGGVLEQQGTDGGWHPVAFFPGNCRAAVVYKTMIILRKTALSLRKQLFLGGGRWGGLCVKRRHMLWYVLS